MQNKTFLRFMFGFFHSLAAVQVSVVKGPFEYYKVWKGEAVFEKLDIEQTQAKIYPVAKLASILNSLCEEVRETITKKMAKNDYYNPVKCWLHLFKYNNIKASRWVIANPCAFACMLKDSRTEYYQRKDALRKWYIETVNNFNTKNNLFCWITMFLVQPLHGMENNVDLASWLLGQEQRFIAWYNWLSSEEGIFDYNYVSIIFDQWMDRIIAKRPSILRHWFAQSPATVVIWCLKHSLCFLDKRLEGFFAEKYLDYFKSWFDEHAEHQFSVIDQVFFTTQPNSNGFAPNLFIHLYNEAKQSQGFCGLLIAHMILIAETKSILLCQRINETLDQHKYPLLFFAPQFTPESRIDMPLYPVYDHRELGQEHNRAMLEIDTDFEMNNLVDDILA